jgi:hypothetical protein
MEERTKDPDATLTYGFNWASKDGTNDGTASDTGWLQGLTIASSTWSISGTDGGLTSTFDDNSTTQTSITLTGGTLHGVYEVTNRMTASDGQIEERSFRIRVEQR